MSVIKKITIINNNELINNSNNNKITNNAYFNIKMA